MNRQLVADYRDAREAQLGRFEARVRGRDRSDRGGPEWCEYFGTGEYAGGGVEPLLTFKSWLVAAAGERRAAALVAPAVDAVTPVEAVRWPGVSLRWLADAGDPVAAAELVRRVERRSSRRMARVTGFAT